MEQLTFFREDFPVNPTAQQEKEKVSMTAATCGPKCLEQYGKFNRAGLWAKTFAALLIGTTAWSSKRCKLKWKLKATKSSRLYFLLQVYKLRTKDIESGLLPTPTVMDTNTYLDPMKIDARRKRLKDRNNGLNGTKYSGNGMGVSLGELFAKGMLPKPNSRDYKGEGGTGADLNRTLGIRGRRLNHQFVLEMMGFPPNWTELPFQNFDPNQ